MSKEHVVGFAYALGFVVILAGAALAVGALIDLASGAEAYPWGQQENRTGPCSSLMQEHNRTDGTCLTVAGNTFGALAVGGLFLAPWVVGLFVALPSQDDRRGN